MRREDQKPSAREHFETDPPDVYLRDRDGTYWKTWVFVKEDGSQETKSSRMRPAEITSQVTLRAKVVADVGAGAQAEVRIVLPDANGLPWVRESR